MKFYIPNQENLEYKLQTPYRKENYVFDLDVESATMSGEISK